MKEFTVGAAVTVSVKTLYESVNNPKYVEIIPDFDEKGNMAYFDLYNDKGELACMDGEVCRVAKAGRNRVVLSNAQGDNPVDFKLTAEEAGICCFSVN